MKLETRDERTIMEQKSYTSTDRERENFQFAIENERDRD